MRRAVTRARLYWLSVHGLQRARCAWLLGADCVGDAIVLIRWHRHVFRLPMFHFENTDRIRYTSDNREFLCFVHRRLLLRLCMLMLLLWRQIDAVRSIRHSMVWYPPGSLSNRYSLERAFASCVTTPSITRRCRLKYWEIQKYERKNIVLKQSLLRPPANEFWISTTKGTCVDPIYRIQCILDHEFCTCRKRQQQF